METFFRLPSPCLPPLISVALLLLSGCLGIKSDNDKVIVYDGCGGSRRLEVSGVPANGEHPDGTDSIAIPGVRIRDYGTHSDTIRTLIKVGLHYQAFDGEGRWSLDSRYEWVYGSASGKPYDELIWALGCFVYGDPKITTQPADLTVDDGDQAVLTVIASDGTVSAQAENNRYEWYRDGQRVQNADEAHLVFTASAADDGAKFKVIVNNVYGAVVSREALVTVITQAPRLDRIEFLDTNRRLSFPNGWDTVRVDSMYAAQPGLIRAEARGSNLTYAWTHKGVPVGDGSALLRLPSLKKSDSGTVVRCIVSNAYGKDTLQRVMKVRDPQLFPIDFKIGLPGNTYYGSLLDLDSVANGEYRGYFPNASTAALQEKLDLILGTVGGANKLLSPRLAKEMGMSSASALDMARLADVKMVLYLPGSGGGWETYEDVKRLYAQGVLRDSVGVNANGSMGGIPNAAVILKTTKGGLAICYEMRERSNPWFVLSCWVGGPLE